MRRLPFYLLLFLTGPTLLVGCEEKPTPEAKPLPPVELGLDSTERV